MSSDIYAKPDFSKKVRYKRKVEEDGGEWEEREVDIYENTDDIRDDVTDIQSQVEGPQTQNHPPVHRKSFRGAALCLAVLCLLMAAGIIVLSTHHILVTLKKNDLEKLNNLNHSSNQSHDLIKQLQVTKEKELQSRIDNLNKSYNELQGKMSHTSVTNSQLQDEIKQLKDKIQGELGLKPSRTRQETQQGAGQVAGGGGRSPLGAGQEAGDDDAGRTSADPEPGTEPGRTAADPVPGAGTESGRTTADPAPRAGKGAEPARTTADPAPGTGTEPGRTTGDPAPITGTEPGPESRLGEASSELEAGAEVAESALPGGWTEVAASTCPGTGAEVAESALPGGWTEVAASTCPGKVAEVAASTLPETGAGGVVADPDFWTGPEQTGTDILVTLEKNGLEKLNNLSHRYNQSQHLIKQLQVTKEKELQSRIDNLTKSYNELQDKMSYTSVTNSQLQDEIKQLKDKTQGKLCPEGWKRFGCSCYFKSTEKKSWLESRKDCVKRESDLVIINSKEEQDFVTELNQHEDFWIGLWQQWSETQYQWEWVDGSQLTETFWATGEKHPTGYFASCCDQQGRWRSEHDYYDNHVKNWICEKKISCFL
ncbi:uncharacterized protein [Channa argus]|uniref:uncharacterized protein n=1 Tax=Channa argus TaxID=215402 RepID=UPI0035218E77